jgi:hypothetical protein
MRFVINASMNALARRAAILLLFPLFLTACGGRSINKKTAQKIISSQTLLKSVDVESVIQATSGQAIVQTRVPAAFRLEKVRGEWAIREVKIGNNPWERLERILAVLHRLNGEETQKMLEQVASALDKYCRKNGRLPDFSDYVSLSDALNPEYLSPLIRLDSWEQPLVAVRISSSQVQLISAGPDGKVGTPDDISLARTCPK